MHKKFDKMNFGGQGNEDMIIISDEFVEIKS